ncbi:MAG TPA: low temperature requirement protein A, partial [Actinomycetota bacterium]|nr:low temperature requirement protein A [Actinomycetota bacterium]
MRADQADGADHRAGTAGAWYRPMVARPTEEEHRSATVLELFFDLCFVVAVAQAAAALHHEVADGHVGDGLVGYATVFFAIWWAWMNFTWFASAYDTDDVPYRLTTLVQIAGALILAAGVPDAMIGGDLTVITLGYVVMRLAMVTQWLRAAGGDPPHRRSSLRFAAGISLVQLGWVLRLLLPEGLGMASFLVLVACELVVPIWAERAAPTTWHPRHIAERYGLFTLIVLGECVLASTLAIESALAADAVLADLATTAAGGLLTVFGMWWLYFSKESHEFLTSLRAGIVWGYGHYLIFAAAAAVGAGLAVN